MNLLFALAIGVLSGCGLWLLLRARTFDLVLGLTLLGYAVNLFIFAMGRLTFGAPAILIERAPRRPSASISAPLKSGSTIGSTTR